MQNNKKQSIEILSLQVRPIDSTSKLANVFPGFELFDMRQDFILFSHINNIAVAIEALNLNYNQVRPRSASRTLYVSLKESDSGHIISSRTFSIRIGAATESEFRRVDIPVLYGAIDPGVRYSVEVTDSVTGGLMSARDIGFFKLEKLPAEYFKPVCAWFELEDDTHYSSFDYSRHSEAVFKMKVNTLFDETTGFPEIMVKQYNPDGTESCRRLVADYDGESVIFSVGFDCGSCRSGIFYLEYTLFGYPFAGHLFTMNVPDKEGEIEAGKLEPIRQYTGKKGAVELEKREIAEKSALTNPELIAAKEHLDNMVGLDSVKTKIKTYVNVARFNSLREKMSLKPIVTPLHSMFLGSPGTGKTTVAKIMGLLLKDAGVLSKGHVVFAERSTLIGKYYSSESEKTREAIERAKGGILFIDEAYQLCQPNDPNDPGKFVVETLMTSLSDESNRDWMLILAGYEEPMKRLFDINPGLKSRIPKSNFYYFSDLDASQLNDVAMRYFAAHGLEITSDAGDALFELLQNDYNSRGDDFGNARHVINIIETSIFPSMADRVAEIESPSVSDLSTIVLSDIPKPSIIIPARFRPVGFAC